MSVGSETRLRALDSVLDAALARTTSADGIVGKIVGAVTGALSPSDLDELARDLFVVVDALESSVALRRAITDPSISEEGRKNLIHDLFSKKISTTALDVVAEGAAMRWAGGRTFAAAIERQAVRATLVKADRDGTLEDTEDELFRFARMVESNPELREAIGGRAVPLANRQALVGDLLDRATAATVVLAKRAVLARERTFAHTIEGFVKLAADQKNRVVATVRVARPLTSDQRERLRTSLSKQVGREIAIQEIIDPEVLGGVRVELGDEVVEGTVADRLEQARRLFG